MKTKNLMVGILVGVLTVALWWTMLVKPTRAKATKVQADTDIAKAKLAPLQAQLNKAKSDAAHADAFKAQLKALQLAMPDSPALATFIRDANGIASDSGASWQSVTHGPPVPGLDGSQSIALGIQVRGTYGQVLDYLTRLAALKRLVVVDTVTLSTAGSSGATTGQAAQSGGSTGPFSGASQLEATIAARMFESPAAAVAATNGSTTAATATATGTAPGAAPGTSQPAALKNS